MFNYQYTDKIQRIYNYFTQSDQSNIIHANDSKDNLVSLEDFKKQKKLILIKNLLIRLLTI